MHAVGFRRTAVWTSVALAGVALLAGCRPTGGDRADFGPTTSLQPSPARCDVRRSVMSARNVIRLTDLGATTGGWSVTDIDFGRCAPVSSRGWSCDLPFPWQTTVALGPAMAALGVRSARIATVVTPHRTVTETILDPDVRVSGAQVLRKLRRACRGHSTHVAMLGSGPVVLALDLTDGTWSHAQERRVLRAAEAALSSG